MMNHMSPVEMEAAVHGQLLFPQDMDENVKQAFLSQNANGIVTDNRKVVEGGVFAAIKGERVDGHDFIQDSFANGALLCISEEDPGDFLESKDLLAGPILRVGSTVQALRDLAAYYRSTLTIPVVGVIGSVGKTSTKEMIASVLGQKFRTLKTEGNQNNGLGLPLTILRIDSETEAAVVEMGISMFGEMHILGRIARPDFVVMTNIGNCHLENLKDRDGVLKAKTEVFEHLHEPATLVLNGDDDKLRSVGKVPGAKIYFYGVENQDTFVHASDVEFLGMKGMKASIHVGEESFSVVIPLPGGHNVMNALAATAVGYKLGLSIEEIRAGIESVQTIAGRSHFLDKNGMTVIDDCYNANPMSMKASLEVLSYADGRKIAVLGDMGELGKDEKRFHYEVGQAVVKNGIDLLVTVGPLSQEIVRAAAEGGMEQKACYHFDTVDAAADFLKKECKAKDAVLVKASHYMNFTKIVKALTEEVL